MAFLDTFGPTHRALMESAATALRLERGEYLIRRGDPGGDVFLLLSGRLEVVDTRSTPELILNTLTEGAVVGEMAFVDDSPRSVDVRAGHPAEVLRWTREDLRSLLGRQPDLAAAFYQQVARLASARIRFLTDGAVSGAFGASEQPADADELRAWVARIVDPVKIALPGVETALRRDPDDAAAAARVREMLDQVEGQVDELFSATRDAASGTLASELLARELHPYLVRSALAERSIRRPQGVVGTAEVLSHVLVDTPGGDGRLGELVDRWLLDRPTFRGMRAMRDPIANQLAQHLPKHRNRRVLLVDAGTGSLVVRLVQALTRPPTLLTVLDQSREALALLDIGLADRPRGCDLNPVQESLARFAMGRARIDLPKQDGIVLHGLLEYLPERIAASLLTVVRGLLTPDGVVVIATLGPSRDRVFLDRILHWPTLRRTSGSVQHLLQAAGLTIVTRAALAAPATLVVAAPPKPPSS